MKTYLTVTSVVLVCGGLFLIGQNMPPVNTPIATSGLADNNLGNLGSAATARSNLGLGSAATQAASSFGLVANPLSQFAATTSAQLRGVVSDESGTGPAVFGGSTLFQTPLLRGQTTAISGTITGVGACTSATTLSLIGARNTMVVIATPVTPTVGATPNAWVSSNDTVSVTVCSLLATLSLTSSAYNVAVIQ